MWKSSVLGWALSTGIFCVALASPPQLQDRLAAGEHTADLSGIKFWYRVGGKGPVVVVQAPGWGMGSEYLQNGLAPLEKFFTVINYDPRGSVHTARPQDPKLMSTDDMTEDLEELRRYWGLGSLTVLGHSQGGAIALGYAIHHSARVHKLVLVDACTDDHDFTAERKQEIAARENDPRFRDAIAARATNYHPATDEEFHEYLRSILPLYFYDPASGLPLFAKTDTGPLPSVWASDAYGAPNRPVAKQEGLLNQVKAQTLVIVGRSDWICPVGEAQRLNGGIQNSRLLILEKSGHFPWIEAPKQFFAAVTHFAR